MMSNKASDRSFSAPSKGSVCQRGMAKKFGLREIMAARICRASVFVNRELGTSGSQLRDECRGTVCAHPEWYSAVAP